LIWGGQARRNLKQKTLNAWKKQKPARTLNTRTNFPQDKDTRQRGENELGL